MEVPWDGQVHAMPAEPSESLALTFELIESLRREFPIDDDRLYGVGLSMGGFGTWDILQRKPELLAAARRSAAAAIRRTLQGSSRRPSGRSMAAPISW